MALLERLAAPFVPGRGTPPDKATRHLPYRKLFKVFDAPPANRPALIAKYLDERYHASRREPYIDQHADGAPCRDAGTPPVPIWRLRK